MGEYYTSADWANGTYMQLPKALIYEEQYRDLSADEILMYTVLRDRLNLSRENAHVFEDETGLFIYYSQSSLAVILGKSERQIRRYIDALKEHGMILIKQDEIGKPGKIYIKNIVYRRTNMSYAVGQKCPTDVGHKCPTNKNEGNKTESRLYKKGFVKPTQEEVIAYCKQKGYAFDPIKFWSHYESNGWMIGKAHMKSWHAACVTWNRTMVNRPKRRADDGTQTDWAGEAERGWGD